MFTFDFVLAIFGHEKEWSQILYFAKILYGSWYFVITFVPRLQISKEQDQSITVFLIRIRLDPYRNDFVESGSLIINFKSVSRFFFKCTYVKNTLKYEKISKIISSTSICVIKLSNIVGFFSQSVF